MKILVTGGAGFIGSHVVDFYVANGYDVVVVDDLSTGRITNLNPAATFYKLDIRDPEVAEIFEKEKPDYINHHAAQMDVRRSVSDPFFDADVNIIGSLKLIEYAKRYQIKKFIYISSGGAAYGEPEYLPCDEDHPVNPICPYGASKHTVEHYLFIYHINYGLKYIVIRYPNVYGPRQNPRGEAGVVAIFSGKMLAGDRVSINGNGEQQRDFVHVSDCARANILAINANKDHHIYNLGSGRGTSINEIYILLAKITGYKKKAQHGPAKVGETNGIYLNADKARQDLGWQQTIPLEKGLEDTVNYYRVTE